MTVNDAPTLLPYAIPQSMPLHPIAQRSRKITWFFRMLTVVFIVTPVALVFVPWQQSVNGKGRVIAYDPIERQQVVTARVDGQIKHWHVQEGQRVEAGTPLVDIEDNDPKLDERLRKQRKILEERIGEARLEREEQQRVVQRQKAAQEAAVKAAEFAVSGQKLTTEARKKAVIAGEALLEREKKEYEIIAEVVRKGNRPEIDLIRQKAALDRAIADLDRLKAEVENARAGISQTESLVLQAAASGERLVAEAERDLNRVRQSVFNIEREIQELDNRVARFDARFVRSPCAGTVLRIEANAAQGGAYVKEGDTLAVIVPDVKGKMVAELWIDGVDLPLIVKDEQGRYPHVRLQFEGWPAVQFVGWPSAARGTFGGRVLLVDPADNGRGQFRILVEPDKLFPDDEDWPSQQLLRQGNQVIGWVFLNRVTLGWEVWRRLNGFPPVVSPPEAEGKKK